MQKKREYIRDGLVREDGSGGILQASRCLSCGTLYFPERVNCPECRGKEFETVSLPDEGLLYTYTVVHMPSAHYDPPYAIGWVEFPEGIRVFGLIDAEKDSDLKIGMKMKAVVSVLWEEEEKEVTAYRFKPLC